MRVSRAFGFGFTSDWITKWRDLFLSQSLSVAMQNPSKCKLLSTDSGKSYVMNFVSSTPHVEDYGFPFRVVPSYFFLNPFVTFMNLETGKLI